MMRGWYMRGNTGGAIMWDVSGWILTGSLWSWHERGTAVNPHVARQNVQTRVRWCCRDHREAWLKSVSATTAQQPRPRNQNYFRFSHHGSATTAQQPSNSSLQQPRFAILCNSTWLHIIFRSPKALHAIALLNSQLWLSQSSYHGSMSFFNPPPPKPYMQ